MYFVFHLDHMVRQDHMSYSCENVVKDYVGSVSHPDHMAMHDYMSYSYENAVQNYVGPVFHLDHMVKQDHMILGYRFGDNYFFRRGVVTLKDLFRSNIAFSNLLE